MADEQTGVKVSLMKEKVTSRVVLSFVAFVVFTGYTVMVAMNHDVFGFLTDHAKGGWPLQIFLDLVVASISFWVVGVPDARSRGIRVWPYVVFTPVLGSIAILAYFLHRSLRESRPK